MGRRSLKNSTDIRRYLASLVTRVETGTLEEEKATKRAYLGQSLLQAIAQEEEMKTLEALKSATMRLGLPLPNVSERLLEHGQEED